MDARFFSVCVDESVTGCLVLVPEKSGVSEETKAGERTDWRMMGAVVLVVVVLVVMVRE